MSRLATWKKPKLACKATRSNNEHIHRTKMTRATIGQPFTRTVSTSAVTSQPLIILWFAYSDDTWALLRKFQAFDLKSPHVSHMSHIWQKKQVAPHQLKRTSNFCPLKWSTQKSWSARCTSKHIRTVFDESTTRTIECKHAPENNIAAVAHSTIGTNIFLAIRFSSI